MDVHKLKQRLLSQQVQLLSEEQESLQKQLVKMAALFGAATALRVAWQAIPFLEPIIPATLLAGTLWGKNRGAAFGAGIMYASNFAVFGGNGPWTLSQCIGMGMVGAIGSRLLVTGRKTAVIAAALATTVYDIVTNLFWVAIVGPAAIISAVPIYLLHLGTNVGLALTLPEIVKKLA